MPPIRPVQLSWFAVTTVLGWSLQISLGRTLGLGPVTVRTSGPGVSSGSYLGPKMCGVDRFRKTLVFGSILGRAWVLARWVQCVTPLGTLGLWLVRMMFPTLARAMPLIGRFTEIRRLM